MKEKTTISSCACMCAALLMVGPALTLHLGPQTSDTLISSEATAHAPHITTLVHEAPTSTYISALHQYYNILAPFRLWHAL